MKKALILTLALLFSASLAFAQGGSIGLFRDTAGTDCNLLDTTPGLTVWYVVHVGSPGATAAEYSAPKPACVTATYLSDSNMFAVVIGNSQTGVSIGYGACLVSPIPLQGLSYFTTGTTPQCCRYKVLPHPVTGLIQMVDCHEALLPATGGTGIVNSNPTCFCNVPTQDTTWGGVKALFTE